MLPRTASRTVHVCVPFIFVALGFLMPEVVWDYCFWVHTCMHDMHEDMEWDPRRGSSPEDCACMREAMKSCYQLLKIGKAVDVSSEPTSVCYNQLAQTMQVKDFHVAGCFSSCRRSCSLLDINHSMCTSCQSTCTHRYVLAQQ